MKAFPHLDYPPRFPVERMGAAGLDALLERGDVDAWARLASFVKDDPTGELADAVLRICAAHPMYGTSALWTTWIEGLRSRPATLGLRELRKGLDVTQTDVARRTGSTQSDVSKLERRDDVRLSTLREYLRALGAELEVCAVVDGGRSRLRIGTGSSDPSLRRPTAPRAAGPS